MRLILAVIASAGLTGVATAQRPSGLSTDPDVYADIVAANAVAAYEFNVCHKDHTRLDLTAAEPAVQAEARIAAALADGGSLVTVSVKELECRYCAAALEEAFEDRTGVAAAYVDPRAQTVSLIIDRRSDLGDRIVRKIIHRRGFEVSSINRATHAPEPSEE